MNFSRWFKIVWWLALLGGLAVFLTPRYQAVTEGKASAFDVGAFGILIGLLLIPLFSEVDFLGVKLKQQVDDLKKDVTKEISQLRNDIRAEFKNNINPVFNVSSASQDAQLPDLKREIQEAISSAFASRGEMPPVRSAALADVPEDTVTLFEIRFALETKLRQLWVSTLQAETVSEMPRVRAMSINRISTELEGIKLLTPDLQQGIREVYGICSHAIHGEKVTPAQANFVKEVGPSLIAAIDLLLQRH